MTTRLTPSHGTYPSIPPELVSQIIEYFVEDLDREIGDSIFYQKDQFFELSSAVELLSLRLVSKSWSAIVLPVYLTSIRVLDSKHATSLLKNWRYLLQRSSIRGSPVKLLVIEEIESADLIKNEDDSRSPTVLDVDPKGEIGFQSKAEVRDFFVLGGERTLRNTDKSPVSIEQAAQLIELLGNNMTKLDLDYKSRVRVSMALLKAVKHSTNIKSLAIHQELVQHNSKEDVETIARLLEATPHLEYLQLDYPFGNFILPNAALPKLTYLSFYHHRGNMAPIARICEITKNTLRVLAYSTHLEDSCAGLDEAFDSIKDTLEGLFLQSDNHPHVLSESLTARTFPRLTVLGLKVNVSTGNKLDWLESPLMRNVRTLMMALDRWYDSWEIRLEDPTRKPFVNASKLRHIVFFNEISDQDLDDDIEDMFASHGITCHPRCNPKIHMMMELDIELNGPIKGPSPTRSIPPVL